MKWLLVSVIFPLLFLCSCADPTINFAKSQGIKKVDAQVALVLVQNKEQLDTMNEYVLKTGFIDGMKAMQDKFDPEIADKLYQLSLQHTERSAIIQDNYSTALDWLSVNEEVADQAARVATKQQMLNSRMQTLMDTGTSLFKDLAAKKVTQSAAFNLDGSATQKQSTCPISQFLKNPKGDAVNTLLNSLKGKINDQ